MPPIPRKRLVLRWAKQSSTSRCAIRNATSQAPSPIERLERQKIRSEAGAQRRKHNRPAQATPQSMFENEQNGWRRHISMVAENFPLVTQGPLLQLEGRFDGVKNFCTARMTDELWRLQACRLDETPHGRRDSLLDKSRQRPREHDPKTHGIDRPTHDVECAWPSVLRRGSNLQRLLTRLRPQNDCCRTIAEKGRRNHIRLCSLIGA